jgi:hypothetical protein
VRIAVLVADDLLALELDRDRPQGFKFCSHVFHTFIRKCLATIQICESESESLPVLSFAHRDVSSHGSHSPLTVVFALDSIDRARAITVQRKLQS